MCLFAWRAQLLNLIFCLIIHLSEFVLLTTRIITVFDAIVPGIYVVIQLRCIRVAFGGA